MAVQRRPIQGLSVPTDPAVEVHLGRPPIGDDPLLGTFAKQRASARNQTDGQRKKAERDRKRNKLTVDLPKRQKDWIEQHATRHGVPPAHLVALLLKHAILSFERGEIDIEKAKTITRNLRYEWFLKIED